MTSDAAYLGSGEPGVGWAIADRDGRLVAVDGGFARRVGVESPAALIGVRWRERLTPESGQALRSLEHTLATTDRWVGDVTFELDGRPRHVELQAGRREDGGLTLRLQPAGSYGLEQARPSNGAPEAPSLERSAAPAPAPAQAPEMAPAARPASPPSGDGDALDALASALGDVANELHNPLAAVAGYAEALASLEGDARAAALEVIERESARAAQLVRDLLAYARRAPLELAPADLGVLVRGVVDEERAALREAHIDVTLDLEPLPRVTVDAGQLEAALRRVLAYVRSGVPASGGTIAIRVTGEADRARVELSAGGAEPVDDGGLGLRVAAGILAAHGGALSVHPAGTVVLELPTAGGVATGPVAPEDAPAARPRVLIVDDEASLRSLATHVLGAEGYETASAGSVAEALEQLASGEFHAILSDVRMPGEDGATLYGRVAERWPGLARRFIVMSGDLESERASGLVREHDLVSLAKPFKLEQLRRALTEALARRG